MKNQSYALPHAIAVTTAIVYILCRLLVMLFPDISFVIAQSWFHGIALGKLDSSNLSIDSFLLGIVSSAITAWIIGYIFIQVYHFFLKRK